MKQQSMNLRFIILSLLLISYLLIGLGAQAQDNPRVGGELMYPSKDIVSNAVKSQDHTTLVAAVKAANLVSVLQSKGPFTVLAPVNTAFDKLPKGTLETLLKPESKDLLASILKYHVIAGKMNARDIKKAIKKNGGSAVLTTVQGGKLTAKMNGPMNVILVDAKGNIANISTYDVHQSNGVIHVIDTVLQP